MTPEWHPKPGDIIYRPRRVRRFKLRLNIRLRGRELPVSAMFGLLATAVIWVIILITQPYSRWLGLAWMLVGFGLFLWFKHRRQGKTGCPGVRHLDGLK